MLENGVPSGEIGICLTYSSLVRAQPFLSFPYVSITSVYNKENLERQETNKYGRGTERHYLRLTRVSSGPRVSVAKTYRDETKRK